MQHCDDDVLALVALGERPSAQDAAHLATCPVCRAEVDSFDRAVTAGRGDREPAERVLPPARVWDGIAAATGVSVRPTSVSAGGPERPDLADRAAPAGLREQPADRPALTDASDGVSAPVLRLRPRRRTGARFRGVQLVAVAAAALVVGGVGGVVGTRVLTDQPVRTVVLAQTALDPLPLDPTATGKAVVARTAGGRTLEVDVSKLTKTDGFYEVWLIDSSVKKMVPIGVLQGRTGRFTIPADLDLRDYPVVDISAEPLDGNPVHSGKSLLRGVIPG